MALVAAALRKLADPAAFRARYGVEDKPVLLFAVGRRQPLPGHRQGVL